MELHGAAHCWQLSSFPDFQISKLPTTTHCWLCQLPCCTAVQVGVSVEPLAELAQKEGSKLGAKEVRGANGKQSGLAGLRGA